MIKKSKNQSPNDQNNVSDITLNDTLFSMEESIKTYGDGVKHSVSLKDDDQREIAVMYFWYYNENSPKVKEFGEPCVAELNIYVDDKYKGFGFSKFLYKKFDEEYNKYYKGVPVEIDFWNPVAEYVYKKEIADGNISKDHYYPEYMKRNTEDDYFSKMRADQKQIVWKDLRKRLPEDMQGNETWATLIRKFIEKYS